MTVLLFEYTHLYVKIKAEGVSIVNEYMNDFEKQEVLQNLKVKARNLNIWRYGMAIAAILLYTDMKTSRIVPSGIVLGIVIALAVAAVAFRFIWDAVLRCPFCDSKLGTYDKVFSLVPNHCPNCGEKLKY